LLILFASVVQITPARCCRFVECLNIDIRMKIQVGGKEAGMGK
jgi:hypothetical protein